MVFYQQSATAEKQLGQRHYGAARGDTALGGVLTQLISASILFAAATTFGTSYQQTSLGSVGQISEALAPHLGATVGRLVFSLGVLGASMVAGIVCSLALAWALGEAAGYRRAPESQPFRAPWFYAVYAACELVGTALAWAIPNLIWLTIAAQIVDVFLLPMVLGFLLVLAASSLPDPNRLHGWYLGLVITAATATCGCAVLGRSMVFSRWHCLSMRQTRGAPDLLAGAEATALTFWLNAVFGCSFGGIWYGSNDGHHPRARGEISLRGHQGWCQSALRARRRRAGYGERGWVQYAADHVAHDLHLLVRPGVWRGVCDGVYCPIAAPGEPGHERVPRRRAGSHGRTRRRLTDAAERHSRPRRRAALGDRREPPPNTIFSASLVRVTVSAMRSRHPVQSQHDA